MLFISVGQRLLAINQEIRTWPTGLRPWVTPREYQYTPNMILVSNNGHDTGKEITVDTERLNYRYVKYSRPVK